MIGSYYDLIGEVLTGTEMRKWPSREDFDLCVDRLIFADAFDRTSAHDVQLRSSLYNKAQLGPSGAVTLDISEATLWPLAEKLEEKRLRPYWPLKKDLERALRYFGPEGALAGGWDLQDLPDGRKIAADLEDFLSTQLNPREDAVHAVVYDNKSLELVHLALELSRRSLLSMSEGCRHLDRFYASRGALPTSLLEGNFCFMYAVGCNYVDPILYVVSIALGCDAGAYGPEPEFRRMYGILGEGLADPALAIESLSMVGIGAVMRLELASERSNWDEFAGKEDHFGKLQLKRLRDECRERWALVETIGKKWNDHKLPNRKSTAEQFERTMGVCLACFRRFHGEEDAGAVRLLVGSQPARVLLDGSVEVQIDDFGLAGQHLLALFDEEDTCVKLYPPSVYFLQVTEGLPRSESYDESYDSTYWLKVTDDAVMLCRNLKGTFLVGPELCESLGLEPLGEAVVVGAADHLEIRNKVAWEKGVESLSDDEDFLNLLFGDWEEG